MTKRKASEDPDEKLPRKYHKSHKGTDYLSKLTDELLLRVLSHVSVYTLTVCQRLSRRFDNIAGDSQLWKRAYYDRFVRPRASRLPGTRAQPRASQHLSHSSRLSQWLDEAHLVRSGKETNWKRQYKLRHNWARGSCGISEIAVGETPPAPRILARLHKGIVYTADSRHGLRSFSYREGRKLLASTPFRSPPGAQQAPEPSALALDLEQHPDDAKIQRIAVGFQDGSFSTFAYNLEKHHLEELYTHAASSNGTISAVAFAGSYLACMSNAQVFSLYRFDGFGKDPPRKGLRDPILLASLRSHTIWPPLSVSLRLAAGRIIASIAYSFPTYTAGWSAGVQELHIGTDGTIQLSRLASAINHGFHSLVACRIGTEAADGDERMSAARPTSLSYSHPYLLFCHADNTMSLYLVNSSAQGLSISKGRRLWGHTSSVFGAHVGGRGRAVSVTTRGEEVRVWELEGSVLVSTSQAKQRRTADNSVRVAPEKPPSHERPRPDLHCGAENLAARHDSAVTRGWVGFDEESVIVLRERDAGGQALTVYDFT